MALDGLGGFGDAGIPPGSAGQPSGQPGGQPGGLIGRTLGGYRLVGLLGVGGMAEVYRGQDARQKREVAVKVLPPALARDASYVARFRKEAERTATFTHPNVVPVYAYGEEDGLLYLVMPLLPSSVRDRLDREGALDPMEAARLAYQVAAALDAAHRRGLVHRDVKPENILLGPDGRALLTDFGIARELDALQSGTNTQTLSVTGLPVGTPEYMAPEQLRNQPLDQRIDIYSLGVVFFEMLTGQVPFDAETPYAVAARVLKDDVPPPSSVNPRIWPALDLVVQNAVARDPGARYPNMRSFAMDIRTAASRAGRSNPRWIALERISQPVLDATRLTPSALAAEPSQPLPTSPGPNSGPFWGLSSGTVPVQPGAPVYVPGGATPLTPPTYAPVSSPMLGASGYLGAPTVVRPRPRPRLSLPIIAAILLAVLALVAIGGVVLLHGLGKGSTTTIPGVHPRATGTLAGTPGRQGAVATHASGTSGQPTATSGTQATATPGGAPTATPGGPTPTATAGASAQITVANSTVTLKASGGNCTGLQTLTNNSSVDATWTWSGGSAGALTYTDSLTKGTIDPTSPQSLPHGSYDTVTISETGTCGSTPTTVTINVANGGMATPGSFTLTY
ncbi:MAG TPA: protein kinase [Ktedonobacterales bacterium]